ncbi:MAG: tRNA (adenosine(37)-N6)-threonylcarbamoyltransferase complex ATPase subunit type 1 TsaE [Bacteroidota bacterium]
MPQKTFLSHSPENLTELAEKILQACDPVKIFALFGEMGAGKTTLVQGFCKALGCEEAATSPTFSLVHTYQGKEAEIHHFDFYRIKAEMEAWDLGLEEYLDSDAYVFMEWPEKIPSLLPEDIAEIHLHIHENGDREIQLRH